jgi:hypothetical protein
VYSETIWLQRSVANQDHPICHEPTISSHPFPWL